MRDWRGGHGVMWQMKDESGFNRTSAERGGYYMRNVDGRRRMPRCKSRRVVCDPLPRSFLMDGYRFVMRARGIRNDRSQLAEWPRDRSTDL